MNGDGYDDVVVGAPYHHEVNGQEGAVYIFHGSLGGLIQTPDWSMIGPGNDIQFGYAVSSAGDVNHDGYDDVLVGAPYLWFEQQQRRSCLPFPGLRRRINQRTCLDG